VHTVRSVCHNRNVHLLQLGEVVASVSLAVAHAGDGHAGSEGVPHVAALHQATKEKEAAASEKKRHGEKCNVLQGWEMAGREEFRLAVLPCPPDRLPCRARTASSDRKQYCASYVPCRRRNSSTNSPVTGTVLVASSGTIVTGTPEWSTSYAAKGSPNTLNSATGLTAKAVNTEQIAPRPHGPARGVDALHVPLQEREVGVRAEDRSSVAGPAESASAITCCAVRGLPHMEIFFQRRVE
jgi:hypothetical protein